MMNVPEQISDQEAKITHNLETLNECNMNVRARINQAALPEDIVMAIGRQMLVEGIITEAKRAQEISRQQYWYTVQR